MVLFTLLIGCTHKSIETTNKWQPPKNGDIPENFDSFFMKFKADKNFQFSRTNFPLKNIIRSEDGDTINIVSKKEWRFTDFKHIKKLVTKKDIINKSQINIVLMIEDTGVYIIYLFQNKSGKWWLTSIEDQSD